MKKFNFKTAPDADLVTKSLYYGTIIWAILIVAFLGIAYVSISMP